MKIAVLGGGESGVGTAILAKKKANKKALNIILQTYVRIMEEPWGKDQ